MKTYIRYPGWKVDPNGLVRLYGGDPKMPVGVFPLANNAGHAVMKIGNEPFSVHPVAAYRLTGELVPMPEKGLRLSTRPGTIHEVIPDRTMRSIGDARRVAQAWVRRHLDLLP